MKQKLFYLYILFFKFILKIVPVKTGKICILNRSGLSGSNTAAIYQYILTEQTNYSDVFMLNNFPSKNITLKQWYNIAQAQVIICSHEPFKISKKQTCIELWHGIPLKRMGYLARNTNQKGNEKVHKIWKKNADVVISSSALYETMMSATIGIDDAKFKRMGFPRNDYLFPSNDVLRSTKKKLLNLFDESLPQSTHILFYLPTFRIEDGQSDFTKKLAQGNFFGFDDYDEDTLNYFLKEKNAVLIVKLHPNEEAALPDFAKKNNSGRIIFLSNSWLTQQKKDLYELLASSDILITDYSSVFFDYLLLDKPEIFTIQDLNSYKDSRGFFIEPYNFITPGEKVADLESFKKIAATIIEGKDSYQEQRNAVKQIVYNDSTSKKGASERIWEQIILPIIHQ